MLGKRVCVMDLDLGLRNLDIMIAPVSAGTVQAVNTTVFALTESGEPGPVVPSQPRALETHEV